MKCVETSIATQLVVNAIAYERNVPYGVRDEIKDYLYADIRMAWIQAEAERLKRCLHAEMELMDRRRTMDGMEWNLGMNVPAKNYPFYTYKLIQGINCGKCGDYVGSVTDLTDDIAHNVWCTCTDHGNFTINPDSNGSIREWIDDDYEYELDEEMEEDFDF
jgi:hypothetical protein